MRESNCPATGSRPAGNGTVVLALATSTERCAVGLGLGSGEILTGEAETGAPGSGQVLALLEQLLAQAGITRSDIDLIAVDHGPGAFTGVRVGCAVAQGLAFALDRPVVPVSSLEAIAEAAFELGSLPVGTLVHACVDARMNEVYFESFVRQSDGLAASRAPAEVLSAERLDTHLRSGPKPASGERVPEELPRDAPTLAAGNGFARFEALARIAAESGWPVHAQLWPDPRSIVRCALRRRQRGELASAERLEPKYVRDKVALDVDEQKRGGS